MKNLKVTLRKTNRVCRFASLPEKEKTVQRFKKVKEMECPSCYGTMSMVDGVWQCRGCAYCISQADIQNGATFWFCDGCGEFLNVQPGFTVENGEWVCVRCHWTNDVTEENVID